MNEQTVSPMSQETPVKEVPMKGIPIKAVSCTQAISLKNPPEVPAAIPIGVRNMQTFPSHRNGLSFLEFPSGWCQRLVNDLTDRSEMSSPSLQHIVHRADVVRIGSSAGRWRLIVRHG